MTDRPILFSAPMIRALLQGRKTQTRRLLKLRGHKQFSEFGPSDTPGYDWHFRRADGCWCDHRHDDLPLPYAPGDRLWVRETWTAQMTGGWTIADARRQMFDNKILYRANGNDSIDGWWAATQMPREFSRLTLTVTDVRVQRLQDISEADAIAEGIYQSSCAMGGVYCINRPGDRAKGGATITRPAGWEKAYHAYAHLWDSINGPGAWEADPWVTAISFDVEQRNIDR